MRKLILCFLFLAAPLAAQSPTPQEKATVMQEYLALLAVPNVAADTPNIRRNADMLQAMFRKRGLEPRLLEAPGDGKTPPAVFAEWRVPGARRTLVLYAHYDGQPADPADWTLAPPFTPVIRSGPLTAAAETIDALPAPGLWSDDWRVYARSASDDKLGVIAILAAIDRLRAAGRAPTYNLKIFFEGEEEAGSAGLPGILAAHRDLIASDGWVILDGPGHSTGAPQVVLGVRGVTSVEVTTYGPVRPLHSGHYGNFAPDPSFRLARLLASMKAPDGKVLISGFYDDAEPLGPADRAAIAALPDSDAAIASELGLAANDARGARLAEAIALPSLDILGMRSADVGANARNVIPTTATATIGLRLVKGDEHARQRARIAAHIREQGYLVLDREPTMDERRRHALIATVSEGTGYNAERTGLDHPLARSLIDAVGRIERPVVLPTLGGSLPLSMIREGTGAPTVTVSLANHDNNQHAENENLRLGNLWRAIAVAESVLLMR